MPILSLKKYPFLTRDSPDLLILRNDAQNVRRAFSREQVKLIVDYEAFLRTDPPNLDALPMPAGFIELSDLWNLHPTISANLCFSRWDESGNLIPGAGSFSTVSLMGGNSAAGLMHDVGRTDPTFSHFILDPKNRQTILGLLASSVETGLAEEEADG